MLCFGASFIERPDSRIYNRVIMSGYDGILLENIWHELKTIREGYESLAHVPRTLERIEGRLDRMEAKSDNLEIWLKDHDKTIGDHGRRIAKLEAAS